MWRKQKSERTLGREINSKIKYFNFKPRHAPHSIIIQKSRTDERENYNPFLLWLPHEADGHGKQKGDGLRAIVVRFAMLLNSLDSLSVLIKMTNIISFTNISDEFLSLLALREKLVNDAGRGSELEEFLKGTAMSFEASVGN